MSNDTTNTQPIAPIHAQQLSSELNAALQHAVLEGLGVGVTIQDATGRLVYANQTAAQLVGFESPAALCAASTSETMARFDVFYADGTPLPVDRMSSRVALVEGRASDEVMLRFRVRGTTDERWSLVRAIPVRDRSGKVTHAINFFREVTEQTRDDEYRRFLLRAAAELNSSLDYEKTLASVAKLAVPTLADWCAVDLVDGGTFKRVATAHVDPAKLALVEDAVRRYPPDASAPMGVPNIVRTGKPEFMAEIPRELLVASAVDEEHRRLIEQLNLRSYVGVPLTVRGETLGAIVFVMAESGRRYSEKDLQFAQALADHAALAIDNARLLQATEKARAAAETDFQLLVESVKDYAIFMLDPKGIVSTWNAGAALIKGYTAEEIIGQHFSRFYPEDVVRSGHCEHELEIATRDGRYEEEGWRIRKDGSRFWANVVITALRDSSGVLAGFAKVTRDLTERKRYEDNLEGFRLLVESVKDYAIFMLDPNGIVSTWNAGAALIKGYTANEIIGQHFSRFYPEEVVRSGHCERELEIATRDGRYEEEGWRIRKDGSRFWASVVITALRESSGRLAGFAKVTRDLTERKRYEEELEAQINRRLDAEQTARLAQLFIGVLGHDLRNPMSAIMTGASYLARIATSEKQTRAVARIASSGDRMARMVEQLLDFTRFGIGGGIVLDVKRADFADICHNVVDELAMSRPDNSIRCDFIGTTAGEWDVARLEQALSNLVGNAVQHGSPDEPVSLRVDGRGDKLMITLHNGGEIPAELLPTLFTPFKSRKPSGVSSSSSGLGLGMYIAQQIIQAHGGEIHVRSSSREGTTFVITLPRRCLPKTA